MLIIKHQHTIQVERRIKVYPWKALRLGSVTNMPPTLIAYLIASTWASRQTCKRSDYNCYNIRKSTVVSCKVSTMSLAICRSFNTDTKMIRTPIIELYLCFLQDRSQAVIRSQKNHLMSIIEVETTDRHPFSKNLLPQYLRRRSQRGSWYWGIQIIALHTKSCRTTSISSTWRICTNCILCNRWLQCTTASWLRDKCGT